MNATKTVSKKSASSQNAMTKSWSRYLQKDPRVSTPPRHIEVFDESKQKSPSLVLLKVYAMLHTPGSELMTITWIDSKTNQEFEVSFDEKFPISLRFRTQTDSERVNWAKDQILKLGGKQKLVEVFQSIFPEFRI